MIVDSNIIIYAIQNDNEQIKDYLSDQLEDVHTSDISRIEVIGYHKNTPAIKSRFDVFFGTITTLAISEAVVLKAIELRQQRKRSLADSIIAATALIYNMPVLTNNAADFADIDGLQVIRLTDVLNA
jgi:predicted nucleic acid-binding protein